MIGLVIFVAIANLGLGYFLAVLLRELPTLAQGQNSLPIADGNRSQLGAPSTPAANQPAPKDRLPTSSAVVDQTSTNSGAASANGAPTAKPTPTSDPTPHSWSEFDNQMETAQDRIRYARSANDKRLGKDVAAQLRDCTQSWHAILQECLMISPAGTRELGDTTHLEMCLAQFETTLANIELLNWTETVDVLLDELNREISALKKLRRLRRLR